MCMGQILSSIIWILSFLVTRIHNNSKGIINSNIVSANQATIGNFGECHVPQFCPYFHSTLCHLWNDFHSNCLEILLLAHKIEAQAEQLNLEYKDSCRIRYLGHSSASHQNCTIQLTSIILHSLKLITLEEEQSLYKVWNCGNRTKKIRFKNLVHSYYKIFWSYILTCIVNILRII
jgi:hypothetical protein